MAMSIRSSIMSTGPFNSRCRGFSSTQLSQCNSRTGRAGTHQSGNLVRCPLLPTYTPHIVEMLFYDNHPTVCYLHVTPCLPSPILPQYPLTRHHFPTDFHNWLHNPLLVHHQLFIVSLGESLFCTTDLLCVRNIIDSLLTAIVDVYHSIAE